MPASRTRAGPSSWPERPGIDGGLDVKVSRRSVRRIGLIAIGTTGLGSLVGVAVAQSVGAPPPSAPLSGYETSQRGLVAGDDGITVVLPNGQDLLLRGDTPFYYQHSGSYTRVTTIRGSTAAEGPFTRGLVPQDLVELPTPPQRPSSSTEMPYRFLPNPTDVLQPGTSKSCSGYGASWITGAALDPATLSPTLGYDTDVLITFTEACVSGSSANGLLEGWGIAEYNWAANSFDNVTEVVPPAPNGAPLVPAAALGSPVVSGGEVYLFSATCDSSYIGICLAGRVFVAQVPDALGALRSAGSYRFFDTSTRTFTDTALQASAQSGSVAPSQLAGPYGVNVEDASGVPGLPGAGLEMVVTNDGYGDYQLWRSPSPAGPWTMQSKGKVPGCSDPPGGSFCYAFAGHPELSTSSALTLSYYDPSYYQCLNACTSSGYISHLYDIAVPWSS